MTQKSLEISLTDEEVEKAVKREGIEHPILTLFEEFTPQLQKYIKGKPATDDNSVAQSYVRNNLRFLAEAVETHVGGYSLKPLEIISIWSKATELGMTNYDLYRLAAITGIKFASMGLLNPVWNNLVTKYFATGKFPKEIFDRKEDVAFFRSRLDIVRENVGVIDKYKAGDGPTIEEYVASLKAGKEIDISNIKKKPYDDLLGRIHENFGNGLIPIYFRLDLSQSTKVI